MEKITNKRICAFLIDLVVVAFIHVFMNRLLRLQFSLFVASSIDLLYFLFKDSLIQGQSIGKWIVGIRVVNLDGNKANLTQYVVRNVFFGVPVINIPFPIVEYFVMAYSKEGLRIGDHLAKTRVIDTRPNTKDSRFLFFSLVIIFVFFLAGPLLLFTLTSEKAQKIVVLLGDFKKKNYNYPAHIEEINGFNPLLYNFIYTRYHYNGESEFFFTGIAPLHPRKISYSSQKKEWRVHKTPLAWTEEEMGFSLASEKAYSFYQRGIALQEKGQIEEAIKAFQESVRTEPSCVDGHLGLGLALKQKGLLDDALKEYKEVLRVKPNNIEANLILYLILLEKERYQDALQAYQAYIKLKPPKNDAEQKKSDRLIHFMEEKLQSEGKTEVSKPDTAVIERKPAPSKEFEGSMISKLKAGKQYIVRLKNGQDFKGQLVSEDSKGLWIEFSEGGRMYFSIAEIKEVSE